jgi:anti-anti-sigma factor
LRLRDVDGVLPLAFACFLLAYIEGVSAARSLAQRHGEEIDPRRELLALGAANAAAAFAQGYPVAGGLSQSTVNDNAGARTPLSLVFASGAIALCLLFLTDLLRNLPDVVLAAIVLVAVKGLVNVRELRRTLALSRVEFWVAMVAFAGVLLLGILKGVLLAAIVSMILLIRRVAVPPVSRLGCLPGTDRYADRSRNPEVEETPGVLVVRVEAALLYFNAGHVRDAVRGLVAEGGEGLRVVVWDLSTSPYVDIAGLRMLAELARDLAARGIVLRLAEAHATVRDLVRREGATELPLPEGRITVAEAVRRQEPAAP